MSYLYGKTIPKKYQKVLGVKQTGQFDDATQVAVADYFGGKGKKINYLQIDVLEEVHKDAKKDKDEPLHLPGGDMDEGSDLD